MKLLLITQVVDPKDDVLGFFCEWIIGLAAEKRTERIEVWCLRKGEWKEWPDNVRVHVLPTGRLGRLRMLFSNLIWTDADTVFVHMVPIWSALGGLFWRLRGKRLVLWYTHGHASIWLRLSLPFVHRVLTATPEAFPIKTPKMLSPGHGISPSFSNVTRIPSDRLRFIGVGRISRSKKLLESIRFFERILEREPRATFTWVGGSRDEDGRRYLQEIETYVQERGLAERVTFLGPRQHADLPELLSRADLLIHLSVTNSLDKVAPEALIAGCSLFSTNPAVGEVLPEYRWKGELHHEAAARAIELARHGVSHEERGRVAEMFSLERLVGKIANELHPKT